MLKRVKKNTRYGLGFSLIELLVVISIIGLLTAILVANFMSARERANDGRKIQDMHEIKSALRLYYNDNQTYPDDDVDLDTALATYMPGISGIGYEFTYIQIEEGDGFNLCVELDSGSGDDDINSQIKCGLATTSVCGLSLGVGNTQDKLYAVCAY